MAWVHRGLIKRLPVYPREAGTEERRRAVDGQVPVAGLLQAQPVSPLQASRLPCEL